MNCQQIQKELKAKGKLSEMAKKHLETCSVCTLLASDLGDKLEAPQTFLGMDLLADTEQQIQGETGWGNWLRNRSIFFQYTIVSIVTLLSLFVVIAGSLRLDIDQYPLWRLMVEISLELSLAGLILFFALRPLHRFPLSFSAALGLSFIVLGLVLGVTLFPVNFQAALPFDTAGTSLDCFLFGFTLAMPILIVLWFCSRGRYSLEQLFLLGLVPFLTGHLGLFLHCPINDSNHLLQGHVMVVVMGAVLAAIYVYWKYRRGG